MYNRCLSQESIARNAQNDGQINGFTQDQSQRLSLACHRIFLEIRYDSLTHGARISKGKG